MNDAIKRQAKDHGMSLLRLDLRLGNLVGESEKIARAATPIAETIAHCVSGSMLVHDSIGNSHAIEELS